ncbi:MAG: hypothetical protein AAGJ35_13055, partial [Myxococcota bacterium]
MWLRTSLFLGPCFLLPTLALAQSNHRWNLLIADVLPLRVERNIHVIRRLCAVWKMRAPQQNRCRLHILVHPQALGVIQKRLFNTLHRATQDARIRIFLPRTYRVRMLSLNPWLGQQHYVRWIPEVAAVLKRWEQCRTQGLTPQRQPCSWRSVPAPSVAPSPPRFRTTMPPSALRPLPIPPRNPPIEPISPTPEPRRFARTEPAPPTPPRIQRHSPISRRIQRDVGHALTPTELFSRFAQRRRVSEKRLRKYLHHA